VTVSSRSASAGPATVTVALDGPSAQLLADQAVIISDLQFVMDCCKQLLAELAVPDDDGNPLVQLALWSAALTAYGRCFTTGKQLGLTTGDVRGLPLQGAVLKFHQWALEQRTLLTMHQRNAFDGAKVGAVLSDRRIDGITILSASRVLVDSIGVRQLGGLAAELAKLTAARAKKQQDIVLADAQQVAIEELRTLPALTAAAPDTDAS
jgi:hypothetical protein